jgi:uncharacterized protein (UPF0332 family)
LGIISCAPDGLARKSGTSSPPLNRCGEADYDAFSDFDRDEAAQLLADAHRFVDVIEEAVLT